MCAGHESSAPQVPFSWLSAGVVFFALAISATGFAALWDVSEFMLTMARTLATGALILTTVVWTVSTGKTKTFCAAYAAAGWSYFLLAHCGIAGKSMESAPPYNELLHVQIAIAAREALLAFPLGGNGVELFSATFSHWFAVVLSCIAGLLAVYCGHEPARAARLVRPPAWRVRFTLVEFLLLILVLAPILAIWTLAGAVGVAYLATWLGVGVAANRVASRLPFGVWQVLVPVLIGIVWAIAIAFVDGSLASRDVDAAMQIVTGISIGIACGLSALFACWRARESPRALPGPSAFRPRESADNADSNPVI